MKKHIFLFLFIWMLFLMAHGYAWGGDDRRSVHCSIFSADNIYIVGDCCVGERDHRFNSVACFWRTTMKGMMRVVLPVPGEARRCASVANAIYVSKDIAYIAGYYQLNGVGDQTVACYWRVTPSGITRTDLDLTVRTSKANAIYVSGRTIYIAGEDGWNTQGKVTACYWRVTPRNITRIDLAGDSASAIHVSRNTLYIAGNCWDKAKNKDVPCYWNVKHAGTTRVKLHNHNDTLTNDQANSIDVAGNTMYIAGNGCYWEVKPKQTIRTDLRGDPEMNYIDVSGRTIYLTERNHYLRITPSDRTRINLPGDDLCVFSIFVLRNKVYTAGYIHNEACYWISTSQGSNRIMLPQPKNNHNTYAYASSIWVSGP